MLLDARFRGHDGGETTDFFCELLEQDTRGYFLASGPCWRERRNSNDAEPLPRQKPVVTAGSPTFGTPYPVAVVVAAELCLPLPRSLSRDARRRQ